MSSPFSLEGKTVLVTGASSGIGRSIAIEASKMGANLLINGRNEEKLNDTLSLLGQGKHSILVGDITLPANRQTIVDKIDKIDGIVHSAGVIQSMPFVFASAEIVNELFDINFMAPCELTRLLLENKKIKKNGSIVFISSVSGIYCTGVGNSIYSSSKGALNGLTKGLALDLSSKGIRVNSIAPAMIETNIYNNGQITDEQFELDKKKYPLKRYGKPEEVAYASIYLLSDASSWTTGSTILIDGGLTLL